MRPNWITCLVGAVLLMAVAVFANAQDVEHGRISYVDNDGLIRGNADDEWSVAQQNSLVMPGDTIWADEQGVLEVEVSGGTFVRLADGSKMDVESMPPSTEIKGWSGSFYIHRLRHSEGDVVFKTPVGDIMIERDSQVRVDVLEEGSTTVTTRWGNAVIYTADGLSVRVNSGNQVFIDPGYAPSSPVRFSRDVEDAFDTWNRERSRRIAKSSNSTKIARVGTYAAPIGTSDLDDYGEWVIVDNSSYWRPTVVTEYVPYRTGRWSYVANHGHVWVGHHPFSYVTSHHGYWRHHNHHGWIWSYHHSYSPAYVASVYHNDQFIWAPLSRHGDAVHISGSYFTAGGFHFSLGYSSYSHSSHILSGHHYYNHTYAMSHHDGYRHHNTYRDAHHWNHYDTHSRHYRTRPHRIGNHGNERHYRPTRTMRGPSEVRLAGGGSYSARSRAQHLEQRAPRSEFKKIAMNSSRSKHRTASSPQSRRATTRAVNFNDDPVTKIAQRNERVRNPRVEGASASPRVVTNRTSSGPQRGTGVVAPGRSGKPTTTQRATSNRSTEVNKPQAGGRSGSSSTPRVTTPQQRPTSPRTSTRGTESPRVSGSTRGSSSTPTRPARPQATTPRPTARPQATSPRSTTSTRPQATSPRSSSRPQSSTSRPSARQPRVSAPRPSSPVRPQATSPRASTSRPQATSPRQSAPRVSAPRQSAPRVSAPRQSAPRQSAPRVSAPRQSAPRQSAPRVSAPRQSAPRVSAPRQSAPSRSAAPQRSSSSSSSSRSSGSSSSSRSSSGGSSRRSR